MTEEAGHLSHTPTESVQFDESPSLDGPPLLRLGVAGVTGVA